MYFFYWQKYRFYFSLCFQVIKKKTYLVNKFWGASFHNIWQVNISTFFKQRLESDGSKYKRFGSSLDLRTTCLLFVTYSSNFSLYTSSGCLPLNIFIHPFFTCLIRWSKMIWKLARLTLEKACYAIIFWIELQYRYEFIVNCLVFKTVFAWRPNINTRAIKNRIMDWEANWRQMAKYGKNQLQA